MNFNEYQTAAQRTSSTKLELDKLVNGALGIAGEAGEVADYIKKVLYQGHKMDALKLSEELGDVLWYISEIATAINLPLGAIAKDNIEKLKKRYPNGFNSYNSLHREGEK